MPVPPVAAQAPAVPDAAPAPAPRPATRPPVNKPAKPRASRGGAFYLDDGPGDDPPPDFASIPDAVPRAEPLHPVANRPYRVFGRGYVPRPDLVTHRERGHASWYGRKFHGRPTSSGERYDMYAMTAAHPTLPIPSYVRVTNVANGRSVVVRVNDRGPFLNRRVIDLTYTAAHKLGFAERGSAEVDVEMISPRGPRPLQTAVRSDVADGAVAAAAPAAMAVPMLAEAAAERLSIETTVDDRPLGAAVVPEPGDAARVPAAGTARVAALAPPTGASQPVPASAAAASAAPPPARTTTAPAPAAGAGTQAWLQVGAFGSRDNAEAARARVQRELPWLAVPVDVVPVDGTWRVRIGPWAQREDALDAAGRIASSSSFRPIPVAR
jgi:rare lipoprotein A